jgi:antitoxin (DNA-binding transcriptional repressor) of toxin-antitoxin stability system
MKELTVGEVRKNFAEILRDVETGAEFGILYGRGRRPVAKLVPFGTEGPIKLGMLEGKGNVEFVEDGKITVEEFLGI